MPPSMQLHERLKNHRKRIPDGSHTITGRIIFNIIIYIYMELRMNNEHIVYKKIYVLFIILFIDRDIDELFLT